MIPNFISSTQSLIYLCVAIIKNLLISAWNTSFAHFYLSSPTPSVRTTIKKQFHPIYLPLRWSFICALIAVYIEFGKARKEALCMWQRLYRFVRGWHDGWIIKRPRDLSFSQDDTCERKKKFLASAKNDTEDDEKRHKQKGHIILVHNKSRLINVSFYVPQK